MTQGTPRRKPLAAPAQVPRRPDMAAAARTAAAGEVGQTPAPAQSADGMEALRTAIEAMHADLAWRLDRLIVLLGGRAEPPATKLSTVAPGAGQHPRPRRGP